MRKLGAAVAAFAALTAVVGTHRSSGDLHMLSAAAFLCAYTTWRGVEMSRFLKIFAAIFSTEAIVFGLVLLMQAERIWPASLEDYTPPESMPLTVAVFSILVFAVSHIGVVKQTTRIADLYFDTQERGEARIWPFRAFRARETVIATAMIVTLVLINQAQVGISVRLSFFSRDWFNAIQEKNAAEFWRQLLWVFAPWAFVYVTSAVVEFVMQAIIQMRWRRWLTEHYVNRWLGGHTHYHMALRGDGTDNPDQRIAEDVNHFIGYTESGLEVRGIYAYSILLISTLSSLVSFSIVLWNLSANFTLPGTNIHVPGFLLWVALIYASVGTLFAHLIGRKLARLNFEKQRREADFRFQLARAREYAEQIALLSGETAERGSLLNRFQAVIVNYLALVDTRKRLTAFIAAYGQLGPLIPYILTAPFFFTGKVTLGVMTQTARAFASVDEALNFFVNYYGSLARFKSVLDRLTSFDAAIDAAGELDAKAPSLARAATADISIDGVVLSLPDGRRIVEAKDIVFASGQSVLLSGPSGSGKSTLFRTLAGIWPYYVGEVRIPAGAHVMLLPQRPYIPIGALAAAVVYPAGPDAYTRAQIEEALRAARLAPFIDRLDQDDGWGQRLSGGEQQRVAIARALLAKPDWLFLDEATSALDETLEEEIYHTLAERLPKTTIVSIGHRSTLEAFHARHLAMTAGADGLFRPLEKAPA